MYFMDHKNRISWVYLIYKSFVRYLKVFQQIFMYTLCHIFTNLRLTILHIALIGFIANLSKEDFSTVWN